MHRCLAPVFFGAIVLATACGSSPPPEPATAKAEELSPEKCLALAATKPPRKPDEPEKITVKHILVKYKESKSAPPSIMRTREAACLRAVEARDALKEGKSFGDTVLVYSDEPGGKTREGSLGSIARTDVLPAFADVAFALAKGESSQVVETEYGFHIIMRTE